MLVKTPLQKITVLINVVLFILLFQTYTFSYGQSHYVDNTASGLNNGTSWENAWESFVDINWTTVKPGDTICISGGSMSKTYHETFNVGKSGMNGDPITITKGTDVGHNGAVIIDGDNTRVFVRVNGYDYIEMSHITGIECGNGGGSGCVNIDGSSYSKFEFFKIEDYNNTHGAFNIKTSNHCIIGHNTISTVSYTNKQVDGIYAQYNANNIYEYNAVTVQNNFTTPHDDCIQLFRETSFIIRGNRLVVNCPLATHNKQGIWTSESEGTSYIYNNLVTRHAGSGAWGAAIGFLNGNGGSGTIRIYNNTIKLTSNETNGIYIDGPIDYQIKNNIIWKTTGYWVCMSLFTKNSNPNNIDYNLIYNEGGSNVVYYEGSSRIWSNWRALGFDANGLNQNPSLDSDLKPNDSDDPSVDAGISLSDKFTIDIEGINRPQGSQWDIGAFEYPYLSSSPPKTPVSLRVVEVD